MKPSHLVAALLSVQATCAVAQDAKVLEAIASLSPCALKCIVGAATDCPVTDPSCVCGNTQLESDVKKCLLSSCTIKESIITRNVTAMMCDDPLRDRSAENRAVVIVLAVLSACMVLLRIIQKLLGPSENRFGLDDIFLFTTMIVFQPSAIIVVASLIPSGMGRDVWTLSFGTISEFGKYFWVGELFYFIASALLKLSFLFFYQRIFPGRRVQLLIRITIIVDVLWGTASLVSAIFQCWPISYFWLFWDDERSGHCTNRVWIASANSIISIVLDVWMITIPLSQLYGLKMAWVKKTGVALMFCLGTLATVVSIIRLRFLLIIDEKNNPTWDFWDPIKWSNLEITVGIVCSCIPSMRFFLVRLLPSVFGSSHDRSHGANQYGESSRRSGLSGFKGSRKPGESNATNCTTIFTTHNDSEAKDDDEVELVHMRQSDKSGGGSVATLVETPSRYEA
ncbi:hypothetical protein HBI68_108950 [Parastagonospora nodorum]|nr:hypothetical protein HBH50_237490 [Parastagonospora nodorum]KAH4092568.1 hypothetical protein HBH48_088130 [Parastagonospora nodorum]KAH4174659.1 hypothetical protein HBH43_079260 [Parastagonospora nodorum]KAH4923429.1 hypothetical protein HBI79_172680 [Parastagonospora nodorum]KAH5260877.1 hypothetical protein HBI71_109530 [Parastagonospora nodorum]